MKKLLVIAFLLFVLLLVKPVQAQIVWPTFPVIPTFPPCFPFCNLTPTKTPTPTINTPTPTPTVTTVPTVTPIQNPSITPTPTTNEIKLYWGAYVGDGFTNLSNLTTFENLAQKNPSIVLFYQASGVNDDTKNFQSNWMTNIRNHGSIPMVTWEFWNYTAGVNQPQYNLQSIVNGNHDAYIRKWAQDSKAWGKPYFLRPLHEMNGNWYPWAASVNGNTPALYVSAWKRMKDIFTQEGVTNVTWVWCPNVSYQGSTNLNLLYPGDNYVDWMCVDGYNWGQGNGNWQTFTNLFLPTYNQLISLSNKPIMIGETGSAEQGGNKGQWINNALGNEINSMPKIKAINWFNANKERDWRINSSTASLNAFTSSISNQKYTTNTYQNLNSNPIPMP